MTDRVVSALASQGGVLWLARQREASSKDSASLDEYDYYLRAQAALYGDLAGGGVRAERIALEGLAEYPDSAALELKLAWGLWLQANSFESDDPLADMAEAAGLVREVLAAEGLPPHVERHARWLHAFVLLSEGNFTAAVAEAERTAAMAPYDAFVLTGLTEILIPAGEYERALDWLATAEALDPKAADLFHAMRGWTYRLTGRPAEAVREYAAASGLAPWQRLSKAIAHVRLGELDAAGAEVAAAQATAPHLTQTAWRTMAFHADPAIAGTELADLAAAGLPD